MSKQEISFLKEKIKKGVGNGIGPGDKNLGKYVARLKVLTRTAGTKRVLKMSAKPTRTSLRRKLIKNKSKK